jgi:hypothetical protein
MKLHSILSLAIVAGLTAPVTAQDCTGDPGLDLHSPAEVPIGGEFCLDLVGPAFIPGFLMASLGEGPTPSVYGDLCLDFPLIFATVVFFDANGNLTLKGPIPCDETLIDLKIFVQFLVCDPFRGVSPQICVTITDGLCDEEYCTYTQGGWGTGCNGNNPGCIRDANFDTAFPLGLVLGDPHGDDDDGLFALVLNSSSAVEAFLPNGSTAGTLTGDEVDPSSSSAGVLAGQLTAAKINVAFDDIGAIGGAGTPLGDLVYGACVDADIIGMSVRDVIALADEVISGVYGSCITSGCQGNDLVNGISISDLVEALDMLNNNFGDCERDNGCLELP